MDNKVILILVDGMRPDSLALCGNSYAEDILNKSSYAMDAQTVMPSVTLPCHVSLFLSVEPLRHGVMTNTFTPLARPVTGLFEQLNSAGKKCAMFYNWEELRDLSAPGALAKSCFYSGHTNSYKKSNEYITNELIRYTKDEKPDFEFLYLGWVDEAGHDFGWMGKEYLESVNESWNCIKRVVDDFSDEYTIIITADHGGHGRFHGTAEPEDMDIPIIIKGNGIEEGKIIKNANIMDIAPTITKILNVAPNEVWEGKLLI